MKKKVFVRPVSVSLSEDVFKQIYEITEKKEISLSDFVRDAVEKELSKSSNNKMMGE